MLSCLQCRGAVEDGVFCCRLSFHHGFLSSFVADMRSTNSVYGLRNLMYVNF